MGKICGMKREAVRVYRCYLFWWMSCGIRTRLDKSVDPQPQ